MSGSTPNGKMCNTDGPSFSIIEDRSGYFIINSVAQLLAYSLSAKNDGDNNACSPSDLYIMGSVNSNTTIYNKFNPWQFSSCSIASFSNFLKKTVDTSRGYTCLGLFLDVNADIPDVSGRLLGQEVTPDQQCRQLYGNNSFYTRYTDMASLSDICSSALNCQDPNDENQHYKLPALFGTSCGDGKMCINGQCVSDPFAPQVNENCVFGDRPGIVYESLTCSQFITNQNGRCYNDVNYRICCSSCNKVYKPILGCEYGDKLTGCQPENCLQYKTQCCKTCNYGTPFTPTTTTQRTTPVRTTYLPVPWPTIKFCNTGDPDLVPGICTSPSVCQTQRTSCCSYCSRVSSATVPVKVDLVHLILSTPVLYYLLN
ncbi:hypothetical protein Btru_066829 [Bulinus truncatus]|nr:hypothetical protein Btru_066829 [Bulinus truncatus]